MTAAPDGRPQPLLWLYGLIAVSLASVGVAIGNLFFDGPLSRVLPDRIIRERCEALHRESADALSTCMAEQLRLRGWVVAGAALFLLAGTLALAVAVPWRDLRRLGRFGRLDSPTAQERFADLCQRHGLSGRRVPRLWVAGPAVRHAFTTALPGRRPTIVVPARLALDPGDRFDAVVTHEIAHVLARDVSWVSAVRGPAWLFVPVFALASVPMVGRVGARPRVIAAPVGITLLAAAVTVLAAALLRLREFEADRYAASAGAEPGLVALFAKATPPRTRPSSWARRVLTRHPAPADRALSLRHAARAWEGGLVQAVAVGFVASTAVSTIVLLASFFDLDLYSMGGTAIPAVTGAAVLALLFPSLVRRARVLLPHPQWWRPVVGTGAGIVLGTLVVAVVFLAEQPLYPLVWPGSFARSALAVAVFALVAAGVVALAVSVAELAARTDRPVVTRLAVGATGLAAVAGLWPVGGIAGLLHNTDDLRFFLAYGLGRFAWPALTLGLLPAYALLSLWRAPHRRLPWLVALVAAAVAGTAAILLRPATSELTDQLRAQQQRWWICTAAGIVVLVVVALATPWPDGWARGVLAATATTAFATGAHYGYGWLSDRPTEPDLFASDVAVAPIWLGCATVLLAAVLVPLTSRHHEFTPPVWSRWLAPAGATVLTAAVALALIGVGVPGGVAMNAQQLQLASDAERYAGVRHALTPQQADRVAQSSVLVIPRQNWEVTDFGPAGGGIVSPETTVSNPACEPLVRESFLAPGKPHLRTTGIRAYTSDTVDGAPTYTDVTVTVYSYDAAVGETVLIAARDALRACPSFSLSVSSVSIDYQTRDAQPPPIGELGWRYDCTMSATVAGQALTGSNAYVVLVAGYTLITVHMAAFGEPLNEELLQLVLATTEHTLLHLN
ncbi:M48 family metalloprotease [Micromonospora sp. NPDC005206]|uniref:M48 family metalloprotease n=1 Tax=Micromonospora sp. NPDC005206 TaxID=3157022 RepID=UPI0033ABE95B